MFRKPSLKSSSLLALVAVAALYGACSDDEPVQSTDPAADTGQDVVHADTALDVAHDVASDLGLDANDADVSTGRRAEIRPTQTQDGVSPDGAADVEAVLGAGEARVGRILGETGFTGVWSHCRTGDFRIYNSIIDVCIQEESTNRYETFTGGKLVDARRHGQTGEDIIDNLMSLIGLRTATADRVYVVRDGSDGGEAVLRVEGYDIELAHIAGVLGTTLTRGEPVRVTTEYRLAPDTDAIEMVTWYYNDKERVRVIDVGDWFAWGDRGRLWSGGHGFGTSQQSVRWLAGFGGDRSYGLAYDTEGATAMGVASLQGIPWAEMRAANERLQPGDEAALRRWFIVGDGTLDSVRTSAHRLLDIPLERTARTITVADTAGGAAAGIGVAVRNDAGALNFGVTNEDGIVTLLLPEGDSFAATLSGLPANQQRDVTLEFDGDGHASVEVAQTGRLKLSVTEQSTDAELTARVELRGAANIALFAVNGTLDTALPAGNYHLVVSRGLEYDVEGQDIVITAGEELEHAVTLHRGVRTEGWISADFHQHMEPSIDSTANVYDRVLDNASQGVELVVPTDHEVITDLRPVVTSLGLDHVLTTFPGVEISPVQTHINIYPMPYQPDLRGRGSIELARLVDGEIVNRRIPEILEAARGLAHDPIIQLNHARNNSGMFAFTNFDPEVDAFTHENRDFSLNFDAMEIINRFRDTCELMHDWAGLLNSGHIVTGLGNSDSHSINGRSGVPRNYLRIDSAPGEVPQQAMRDALRNQKVTVGSLAYMDFGDDKLPGDTVSATAGAAVSFHVRVQTPNWSHATRLFVIVNGRIVETIERTTGDGVRFDFDEMIDVTVDEDSWVIFFAYGPNPSGEMSYNVPVLAFNNPVFIDVDGDGWQAPGAGPLDMGAINVDGFCD